MKCDGGKELEIQDGKEQRIRQAVLAHVEHILELEEYVRKPRRLQEHQQ